MQTKTSESIFMKVPEKMDGKMSIESEVFNSCSQIEKEFRIVMIRIAHEQAIEKKI